jgi:limonene-1,2-epoxide hydrolase
VDNLRKAAESAKQVLENKRLRADEHMIAIVVDDLRQALEQWDTSDMAYRPNGLTVDVTDLINRAIAEERRNLAGHYLAIMRDAVEQAVFREREACAKLCDGWGQYHVEGDYAAKAIRGRTE